MRPRPQTLFHASSMVFDLFSSELYEVRPVWLFEARSAFEITSGPPIFGRPMGPGVLAVSFWGLGPGTEHNHGSFPHGHGL
jgi:hypothetical protein